MQTFLEAQKVLHLATASSNCSAVASLIADYAAKAIQCPEELQAYFIKAGKIQLLILDTSNRKTRKYEITIRELLEIAYYGGPARNQSAEAGMATSAQILDNRIREYCVPYLALDEHISGYMSTYDGYNIRISSNVIDRPDRFIQVTWAELNNIL